MTCLLMLAYSDLYFSSSTVTYSHHLRCCLEVGASCCKGVKSLYLNANVEFYGAAVACAAEQVKLLFAEIVSGSCDMKIIEKSLKLQNDISLKHLTGISKGAKNNELRKILIDSFGEHSSIPTKVLKGKNPVRIFWSVINKENIDEIEKSVFYCLSNEPIGI